MPEAEYSWLPKTDILTFEEIVRLTKVFVRLGVRRVRLTGGEPLLRRDLPALVAQLAAIDGVEDLALTTNGVLLAEQAEALRAAGLQRITVSLDTLDRDTFVRLTRADELGRVRSGLEAAARVFPGFKIDTVVVRGVNDGELVALLAEARRLDAELRFIEYMDVGGATGWTGNQVVSRDEILATLVSGLGPVTPAESAPSAPATRFRLATGQALGIIASTTTPFCAMCDRSRLTADGMWYLCLYATAGLDVRGLLRAGASDADLAVILRRTWEQRRDRGAEDRLASRDRRAFVPASALKRNPHLEMHTRGG
jgi:cyclic pyranopterin phosphate synthase